MKSEINSYEIIETFKRQKIAVIGDTMIDEYIIGNVDRVSPEAPVPVLEVKNEYETLGGAANVANNICSLGGSVKLFSVAGNDKNYHRLEECLKRAGISSDYIVRDIERPTIVKTRLIAHHQQIARVDRENRKKISSDVEDNLISLIQSEGHECGAFVISDYLKGVVTNRLVAEIIKFCKKNNKIVLTDPKEKNFALYNGSTMITPNHREAGIPYHRDINTEEDLIQIGKQILTDYRFESLLITRGEQGMTLFFNKDEYEHIPTAAKEVYDVSGAGDTVIGVLALALSSGLSLLQSSKIANFAAGIVVSKLGTATIKPEELSRELEFYFDR